MAGLKDRDEIAAPLRKKIEALKLGMMWSQVFKLLHFLSLINQLT